MVALYRKRRIILENRGLAVADRVVKPASAPTLNRLSLRIGHGG
jgi:hypothetical protein